VETTTARTEHQTDHGWRCHYCDRRTHHGRFLADFTDGKRRWVCSSCEDHMATDLAQEQDPD